MGYVLSGGASIPVYPYSCPECDFEFEVVKPLATIDAPELCPHCEIPCLREVAHVQINTSNCIIEPHFNYGLGKRITNSRQVKEELRRIKGETGQEIVEVGNDNLKSIKKKRKEYTLD